MARPEIEDRISLSLKKIEQQIETHDNKIRYEIYSRMCERLPDIEELRDLFPEIVGLNEREILWMNIKYAEYGGLI